MSITAQQLRELVGKADALPFGDEWVGLKEGIQHLLWHNIEAIISALDLQERLEKPETVEEVARAICCNSGICGKNDSQFSICQAHTFVTDAQAAITAMKGSGQ